jgi:hypothetical protein
VADRSEDDPAQRPVRDPFAVGKAPADERRRLLTCLAQKLVAEAGLADPCRPDDRREPAAALAHGGLQLGAKPAELLFAAD